MGYATATDVTDATGGNSICLYISGSFRSVGWMDIDCLITLHYSLHFISL